MDVSEQFSDLMMAFGKFVTKYFDTRFVFEGMEVSVSAIFIFVIIGGLLIGCLFHVNS